MGADYWFWGYLHANGSLHVKRWFGDTRDYGEDCENNPFVAEVVSPFRAASYEHAREIVFKKIYMKNWRS